LVCELLHGRGGAVDARGLQRADLLLPRPCGIRQSVGSVSGHPALPGGALHLQPKLRRAGSSGAPTLAQRKEQWSLQKPGAHHGTPYHNNYNYNHNYHNNYYNNDDDNNHNYLDHDI